MISNHRYFTQLQLFYPHIDCVCYLYVVHKMPNGLTDDIASLMRSLRSAQAFELESLYQGAYTVSIRQVVSFQQLTVRHFFASCTCEFRMAVFSLYIEYHSLIIHFLKKTLQNRFRQIISVHLAHITLSKARYLLKNFLKIIFFFWKNNFRLSSTNFAYRFSLSLFILAIVSLF